MPTTVVKKKRSFYGLVMILGAAFMLLFGYVIPPFGGITDLGMKMLGVLIGLIIITCFGGDLLGGSLLALLCTVFHGYYTPSGLFEYWLGSNATVQLIFCGAICLALRESGAMDVVAKKMLGSRLCKGRPLATLIVLFSATYVVGIFINGAPIYILFFTLLESIRDICGYDKKDPFIRFTLLGIYLGALGTFFFAWKAPQNITIALIETLMEPYGMHLSSGVWMFIQAFSLVGFNIIYAVMMKTVFKVNLQPLSNLDINKVESMKDVSNKFNRDQKIIIAIMLACVAYIMITTVLPSTIPYYDKITCFGSTWIWVLACMGCACVRRKGTRQSYLPMGKLLSNASTWGLIALVGALMMLGQVTSDESLGIRGWLINVLSPLFGNMNLFALMAVVVIFTTLVTNICNGLVLTMAVCPVITPFVCEMAATSGINPSVILTVVNCCANVAYLTVAGSVNAAYLLGREEITQKFIWTKGVIVLCAYMVFQYAVGMVFSYVL